MRAVRSAELPHPVAPLSFGSVNEVLTFPNRVITKKQHHVRFREFVVR
jgi:hypothetical protein